MSKETMKRYAISSVVTFLTGFGMVFLAEIDSITMDTFKEGGLMGIVFMAGRAGIKAVLEYFLSKSVK